MCDCIAPHEGSELDMVIAGVKPLAIIYRSKQPQLFVKALWDSTMYESVVVRYGVLAIAKDIQTIRSYKSLVTNRKSYTREQYQRCIGKLFGYENYQIEEFIQSEIGKTCTCVECGGEL